MTVESFLSVTRKTR